MNRKKTLKWFTMLMVMSMNVVVSSCGSDDDDSGSSSSALRSLDGGWRMQTEMKVKITDEGEESVLWEEEATDYILVFNSASQSLAYAWADDDAETVWKKNIYSYEFDELTRTIKFSDKNYKILSSSGSKLEIERSSSGNDFDGYKNVYRQTYTRISNAENLIGSIEWPKPKAQITSEFFVGKWENWYYHVWSYYSSDPSGWYIKSSPYYWLKSDGTCIQARKGNYNNYSHYTGTWSFDNQKRELTVSIQNSPSTWKIKEADGEGKDRYFIIDDGSEYGEKWTPTDYMFPEY